MFKTLSANTQVLVFILLVYIMSAFGRFIYTISLLLVVGENQIMQIDTSNPKFVLSYTLFFQIHAFLISFLIMLRLTGQKFKNLVFVGSIDKRKLGITVLICIGALIVMPLLSSINAPLKEILPPNIVQNELARDQLNDALMFHNNGLQFVFSLLIMALLPAICEELIFRGFLIGKIKEGGGSENMAIIISAAIFALTHLQPLKFLPMFFLGLCLGFIYLKFRNIKYAMLFHFLVNGLQITIAYLVGSELINIDF